MPYTNRFIATDNLIIHLKTIIGSIPGYVQADYAGFLAVSAVTVYELAIKDIFNNFAYSIDQSFGNFVSEHFRAINGKIKFSNLRKDHIERFGNQYLINFDRDFDAKQQNALRTQRVSIEASYTNLILCRHDYVHKGSPTLSLPELMENYEIGKEVIHSLNTAMQ